MVDLSKLRADAQKKDGLDAVLDLYDNGKYSQLQLMMASLSALREKQTGRLVRSDGGEDWDRAFAKIMITAKQLDVKDLEQLLRERKASDTFHLDRAELLMTIKGVAPQPPVALTSSFTMTLDQEKAWKKINTWLRSDRPYFAFKGVAGSGKSYLLSLLLSLSHNFHFSAPTNKASKVLSDFLGEEVRTTYSLLGLRMTSEEDKKVLTHKQMPDLGNNPILVIDEAGMIPSFMAVMFEDLATKGWRFVFVGDPFQWNPIGESSSKVWKLAEEEDRVLMTEVKRFDNQLLKLSIRIRKAMKAKLFDNSPIRDDNDGKEGVFVVTQREMLNQIKALKLDDWRKTKVVCWRNKTVNKYNRYIRRHLGLEGEFAVSDLVLMAAPVTEGQSIIAYTDEEFQISSVNDRVIALPEGDVEVNVFGLVDKHFSLKVPKDPSQVQAILSSRASAASKAKGADRKRLWASFWNLKDSFHAVRHGYSLTSHRVQGTTLDNVFLDQHDILANSDSMESFRGLYVGSTRPQHKLITF